MELKRRVVQVCLVAAMVTAAGSASAEPMGTGFTYQGQLKQGGVPVNCKDLRPEGEDERCSFRFTLWTDDDPAGTQTGDPIVKPQEVANGLFTVKLNNGTPPEFGPDAFNGDARWLEVAVCRPPADCTNPPDNYSRLLPRQELTPIPYALYALAGPGGGGDGHSLDAVDGRSVDVVFVDDVGTSEAPDPLILPMIMVNAPIKATRASVLRNGTILLNGTESGSPLNPWEPWEPGDPVFDSIDGFRIRVDERFFNPPAHPEYFTDALVFEKTDYNDFDPDGGIAFVNTGDDGVSETAMVIRGNGNVGIGTSHPDALLHIQADQDVLEYLHLSGFDNDGAGTRPVFKFLRARGSAAVPAIVQDGDTIGSIIGSAHDGNQYWNPAAIEFKVDGIPGAADMPGRIEFQTAPDGGTGRGIRMTIDSNGNVGIGTAGDSAKLSINAGGSAVRMFNLGTSTGQVQITGPGGDPGIVGFANNGNRRDIRFDDTGIRLLTNNSSSIPGLDNGISITEIGRVGIGAAIPSALLDIEGAGPTTDIHINNTADDGDPTIRFQLSGSTKFSMGVDDSDGDKFKIGTGAPQTNTRMTIDSDGNVGIGTSSPGASLEVVNHIRASRTESSQQYVEITSPGAQGLFVTGHSPEGNKKNLTIQNVHDGSGSPASSTDIVFRTGFEGSPTEIMRLGENGNVAIGTTDPAGYRLNVNGPVNATDLLINGVSVGGGAAGLVLPYSGEVSEPFTAFIVTNTHSPFGKNTPIAIYGKVTGTNSVGVYGEATRHSGHAGYFLHRAGGTALQVWSKLKCANSITLDGELGRVGIGTPIPVTHLDVSSDASFFTGLNLNNTTSHVADHPSTPDQRFLFQVNGSDPGGTNREGNFEIWGTGPKGNHNVFTATPEGCVGIGTANPLCETGMQQGIVAKLHVVADPINPETRPYAGWFEGRVRVNVLEISGADLAEKFPVSEETKPGMVVAIDPNHAGQLHLARGAYNRRVAGVVSGANGLSVGVVLGNLPGHEDAPPIAMSGRVYVWADASDRAIQPGDLLTTSDTPGHAMKVIDHGKAQGAILGKAMSSLAEGRGLVLVLVTLQ